MPLQNFVSRNLPAISAAWLNIVDALKFTVFNDAVTKSQARAALSSDAGVFTWQGTDTGVVNASVVTPIGQVGSLTLVSGLQVTYLAITPNTGPATLNFAGTGVKSIVNQLGNALTGGELSLPAIMEYTGTVWKIIAGLAPSLARTSTEIASAKIPVNYLELPGYVERFGALGDNSANDGPAFENTLASVGDKGTVYLKPNRTYIVDRQLLLCTSGATGADVLTCPNGMSTIKFSGLSSSTDCLLVGFGSDTTRRPQVSNLTLNAQGTAGRDLISVRRCEHGMFTNLYLISSVRDAFALAPQADFDSVENARLEGIHVQEAGRHGFANIVGTAPNVGPFITELVAIECEVRGYSWKEINGAAFYFKVNDGHGQAAIGDHVWIGCNVNVDNGAGSPPFAPLPGVAYIDYNATGTNNVNAIMFLGGGWETTSTPGINMVERHASLGATTSSWTLEGQIVFNLGNVVNPGVNWRWTYNSVNYTNGPLHRNGATAFVRVDPGATGSGEVQLYRSAVQRGRVIWNNEFGQGFWDSENTLNFRKFSGSVSFMLLDYAADRTQFARTVYLPQDTKAAQTACAIYAGTGVPNNANGNNGDYYFRSDTPGTANQRLYVKAAGAWVGIL